ncbi:SURF1 family protein [Sphingomonas sp. ZT3P38]|uniref:SURF1 family protein n=1 Tax=Parasphingomonas zepuensis TaxID=3096161 RepID=UPI002FC86927
MKRSILVALALLATLAFVALGVWQIERRAWKLDLIARVESRLHAAPVPFAAAGGEEYRRVTLTGTFLNDRATLVQALTERGAGFWLLTPLRTPQGIVLVNRGFVLSDQRGKADRWRGPDTAVTVIGLLRLTEPKGGFLRTNDPAADRWYSRDVTAIARARALGPVPPFFVDADATPNPGIYPIGGLTVVRFNNNHLVYALTWFGLAGLSGFAAFLVLRKAR